MKSSPQQLQLRLALLGPPQVNLNGTQLPHIKSRKGIAMLAYLVVTGRPQARSQLAGLFWGHLNNAAAANNLRVILHHLNKQLPGYLHITRATVAFNPESNYWLDTEQLRRGNRLTHAHHIDEATISRLAEVLSLYRGEFMEGFFLDNCPQFEQWLLLEQERWRQTLLRCAHYLIEAEAETKRYAAAIAHARQLLSIAPWYEEGHRQLMRLLALTGQRGAAAAQYYQCRRILYSDMGTTPDTSTELLYRRIIQEHRGVLPATLFVSIPPETEAVDWEGLPLSAVRSQTLNRLTRAAERAWREYNHDDTLRFLSAALELTWPEDNERHWRLLAMRERVYNFIADRAAQGRDLAALGTLAEQIPDILALLDLRVRQIQHACRIGEYAQALTWGEQALEQARQHQAADALARVHEVLGETCWYLGDYPAAIAHVKQSLEYYLMQGDQVGEVRAHVGLGNVWRRLGQIEQARSEWEHALRLYRAQENEWGMGLVLNNLGALDIDVGDYSAALDHHRQALALRQRLGDQHGVGGSLNNLGIVYYMLKDYEVAHEHASAAVALAHEIGERSWLISFLETATRIETARQHYEEAHHLCTEGLALSRESGDRHNAAFYYHNLGEIGLAQGNVPAARTAFAHACRIRRELNERGNLGASLAGYAQARLTLEERKAALADARESLALVEEGNAGEYALPEVQARVRHVVAICSQEAQIG